MRFAMFVATIWLGTSIASAGTVSKCVDAKGAVTYSDSPCPSSAKATKTFAIPSGNAIKTAGLWCDEGRASDAIVQQCVDRWRKTLRDPRSAYADAGELVVKKGTDNRQVFVDGHARNGFGGMNAEPMQCAIVDDSIDEPGTSEWIKLADAYDTLNMKRSGPPVVDCSPARPAY